MPSTSRLRTIVIVKIYGLSALLGFGTLFIVSPFVNYILLYYTICTLVLVQVFTSLVSRWISKERILPEGKAVFISGCDRGFGYMLAQKLDDLGFQVFAGCLFPQGEGAESLRRSGSGRLHLIDLDVTNDSTIKAAHTYVEENLKDNVLWAVVNNAAIIELGEIYWTSMEAIRRTIDVNTFGVIRLTKTFLPMLKRSEGRVVSVASMLGSFSAPWVVPYSVSKAAVISFCDGLRRELYKWNIQVITVEPGYYRTPATDEEHLMRSVSQALERAPKDVKDMYPETYIKKVFTYSNLFKAYPNEVILVMQDAITALYPQYHYTPGSLTARLLFQIVTTLPKPLTDMILNFLSGVVI